MLTNLFSKKAENLSPTELLARVERHLQADGYEEDKDANHQMRTSMLEEAQNLGIKISSESQICPVELAYKKPQSKNGYLEQAVISRANPGKGVQVTDKIKFTLEMPFLQTQNAILKFEIESTLEGFLSLPHHSPIKSAAKNLITKVADRVMSYF